MRPRAPLVCSVSRDSHLPRGHLTHPEPSPPEDSRWGLLPSEIFSEAALPNKTTLSLGVSPAVLSTSGTPYGLGWSCFHRVLPRTWPWLGSKESFSESQGAPRPPALSSHILVIPGHSSYSDPFIWGPRYSLHIESVRGGPPPLPPLEALLHAGVLPVIFRACARHGDQGPGKWCLSLPPAER